MDSSKKTYPRQERGPMGVNYFIQTKGGWMQNEIYYCIDSDDVDPVVYPLIKKLMSARNLYIFCEFPVKTEVLCLVILPSYSLVLLLMSSSL